MGFGAFFCSMPFTPTTKPLAIGYFQRLEQRGLCRPVIPDIGNPPLPIVLMQDEGGVMPPIATSRIMIPDRHITTNGRDLLNTRFQTLFVLTLAEDFRLDHANF